ncbi:MAG: arginase family protein [Patescibacteria group bacterium]
MNLDELVATSSCAAQIVAERRARHQFILAIGGGQEIDLGVVSGIAATCDGELGVGAGDGHLDFNTSQTTITGNPHGMTLSSLMGLGHSKFTNIHRPGRKILPRNVVVGCVNSHTPDFFQSDDREMDLAIQHGVRFQTMHVFKQLGRDLHPLLDEIDEVRRRVQAFIALIDMDVVDQKYAPGVAMRNPDGWHPDELLQFTGHLQENRCGGAPLVAATIVEIDPLKDENGITATLAINAIQSLVGMRKIG